MAELSVAQKAVLAQMVERLADGVLKTLSLAVAQMPGDRARALSRMLAEETEDRRRRALAFAPLLPMFNRRADGIEATTFPRAVLPRLWKAASAREVGVLPLLDDYRPIDENPRAQAAADRLALAAAAVVRDQPEVVWPPDLEPSHREQGLADLTAAFDLAILARRGLRALPDWIHRPTEDQLAELRLLIRDAAGVMPDGGPRILEILFAHLEDASLVLRLVIHSSRSAAREGVLSESEMAGFVDRLIAAVEARVGRIVGFRSGETAPAEVRADLAWSAQVLAELDRTLQLDPQGEWGRSARDARERINRTLAGVLTAAEKSFNTLMPTRRVQTAGRMTRQAPDLQALPSTDVVRDAVRVFSVIGAVRTVATVFGCEARRHQVCQATIDRVTDYADQVLEIVNAGEVPDRAAALGHLETLARLLLLIEAADPARTLRRRISAAGSSGVSHAASEPSPRAA